MSVIESFYTQSYTQKRYTTSSATGSDTLATLGTGNCVIRPVRNKSELFNENNWGREFKLFLDEDLNTKEGDIFTISSVDYTVAGVMPLEDLQDDSESHNEIRVYTK